MLGRWGKKHDQAHDAVSMLSIRGCGDWSFPDAWLGGYVRSTCWPDGQVGKICDNRMRVSSSRIYLCCGVVERVRAGLGRAVVRNVVLYFSGQLGRYVVSTQAVWCNCGRVTEHMLHLHSISDK